MFVGGQTGTPKGRYFGEITPMRRIDFQTGELLLRGMLATAAYRPPGVQRRIVPDPGVVGQPAAGTLVESLWPATTVDG